MKRNLLIALVVVCAAYCMVACEPPPPATCVYDITALVPVDPCTGAGMTCREGNATEAACTSGMNPPASCPNGTYTADQTCADTGMTYTGTCTYGNGGVDYFAFGDCADGGPGDYTNKYSCEAMAGGTFDCLL